MVGGRGGTDNSKVCIEEKTTKGSTTAFIESGKDSKALEQDLARLPSKMKELVSDISIQVGINSRAAAATKREWGGQHGREVGPGESVLRHF